MVKVTAEHLPESKSKTAGISCQFRSTTGWAYSPYQGTSKLRSMKLVHPAPFQLSVTEKDSAGCYAPDQTRTVWGVGSDWLNEGFPFHTLIENGQRPSAWMNCGFRKVTNWFYHVSLLAIQL